MRDRGNIALLVIAVALAVAPAPAAAQSDGGAPQLNPGALNRFYDGARGRHWVTPTGVAPGYAYERTLGFLLPGGGPGRHAVYGCLAGGDDRFLSLDANCEGQVQLGRYGFAYTTPPEGVATAAIWRCVQPVPDHFVSPDAGCEGHRNEGRLGFLPQRGTGLVRHYAGSVDRHWVTAAPVPPAYGYEKTLGYLLEAGGPGRAALYSCRAGSSDQFLSLDAGCEGREPLGLEGFVYTSPTAAEETVPVYRCNRPGVGHFASSDPACEGTRTEGLLGHLRRWQPALTHYVNAGTGRHWVTTGAPGPGYRYHRTLGFLLGTGGPNLHALYACLAGTDDHFLSRDAGCEGRTVVGRAGFAFDAPPAGEETVAVYRCNDPGRAHFASLGPECEGHVTEGLLGYVRTVEHGPPPPPSCGPSAAAAELTVNGKRRRVLRYGRQPLLTGRAMLPGGAPAAGFEVLILEGATVAARTVAGPDGAFALRVPAGPSRSLVAAFRAQAADPALACSAPARVAVRAKARLKATPRRLRAGRVVRFRGRVAGPLPPGGKLLDLQAFDGGRWRKFATVRSGRSGKFRARYRFSRQARPKTYRFRVRVPAEAGFPYVAGTSNRAKVRVRPRR